MRPRLDGVCVEKIDLKKELKHLYQPSAREVVQVDVPAFRFLMIDGAGDPNTSPHYARAVEALFSVSYTAKFMVKKGPAGIDYAVMPLEGLWWSDDMASFVNNDRTKWRWTMMIHQPACVDDSVLRDALAEVKRKKGLAAVDELRIDTFAEGLCAQTLHVGPFTAEGPTIQRVHDFIETRGSLTGKHHEIYLSDIRRADPGRWKTIVRQPMTRTSGY
nr:GyrI-like domain-containing protein [Massilia rhizosphaerae]